MTKKYLVISSLIIITAIMVLPRLGLAQSTAEQIQAQINALMQQVTQLQNQLAQTQGGTTQWCHTFNTNLGIGSRGSEVDALWTALIKEFPGEAGNLSQDHEGMGQLSTLGEITASVVSEFQQKYADEILTPLGLKYGTGYVGKATRAKLNQLYGCGATITSTPSTFTTPYITVLSPNGGESWEVNRTYNIQWNFGGLAVTSGSFIRIELERVGVYKNVLVDNYPISKTTYSWQIMSNVEPASNYKIWVTVISSDKKVLSSDASDAPFSIVAAGTPSITVLSPNGGESWALGQTYNIKWTSSNLGSSAIGIALVDSVTNGSAIYRSIVASTPNSGSYSWTIPNCYTGNECSSNFQIPVGNYKILIYKADKDPAVSDSSDAAFSIVAVGTPTITVLSPNGGESWQIGKTYNITWNSSNAVRTDLQFGKTVAIDLVGKDNLGNYNRVVYGIGTSGLVDGVNSYLSWTIPSSIPTGSYGTDYKIRISTVGSDGRTADLRVVDYSDASFSIVAATTPSITVLSPNGGEMWTIGNFYTITWKSTNVPTVMVDLIRPGYECHLTSGDVINGGSIAYNIGTCANGISIPPASDYRIRVMYRSNTAIITQDDSDAPFSIVAAGTPSITVLAPNGGESWQAGGTYTVSWNANNLPTGSTFYLVLASVGSTGYITTNLSNTTRSYTWTIPSNTPLRSDYYVNVRLRNANGIDTAIDSSDAPFSIVAAGTPSITVLSPNGGESFSVGSTITIKWANINYRSSVINIFLYKSNTIPGANDYNYVAQIGSLAQPNDGTETWTIPSTINPGNNYFIRINLDVQDPQTGMDTFDDSDAAFSIVAAVTNVSDYNNDGILDKNDASYLLEIAVGNKTCPAGKVCDLNKDGLINSADSVLYLGALSKLDYTNDGKLDGDDSSFILEVAVGKRTCPAGKVCDLNKDGITNSADGILVQRIIQGLDPMPDLTGYVVTPSTGTSIENSKLEQMASVLQSIQAAINELSHLIKK